MLNQDPELEQICEDEGFREKPYQDHLGNWTFGYGQTYIKEEHARYITNELLSELRVKIIYSLCPWIKHNPNNSDNTPVEVINVLTNMAYQLGPRGLLEFKKMLIALEFRAYKVAAKEMLDSKWAKQTPNRAKRLASRIEALHDSSD